MKSEVAIIKGKPPLNQAKVDEMVYEAVNLVCQVEKIIEPGSTVLLKPNLFAPLEAPATTDKRVVSALIKLIKSANPGRITVGDSRSISTAKYRKPNNTTRKIFEVTGMAEVASQAGAEISCFEEEEFVEVEVPQGKLLKRVPIPKTVWDADVLINVPVMKVHGLTGVTLGIKNLHGILPDEWKIYAHRDDIHQKLVDILKIKKPALTVLDALRGLEYEHTERGSPVELNLVIAGEDTVAVDAVACSVMGIDPQSIDTIRIAQADGLGMGNLENIVIKGEEIEKVRKPFRRTDLRISGVFPKVEVYIGGTCNACKYYIQRGLEYLQESGVLDKHTKIAIVFGVDPKIPQEVPEKVIMIGDCALASESVKQLRDHFYLQSTPLIIHGCPPMGFPKEIEEAFKLAG